jgi:hypothetical protein
MPLQVITLQTGLLIIRHKKNREGARVTAPGALNACGEGQ